MLREMSQVRQIPGDYFRRWFTDEALDLFVWLKPDGAVHGFQICYDRQDRSMALTWLEDRGFLHDAIDWGDDDPLANRTPILVPGGAFKAEQVFPLYLASDHDVPAEIRDFIRQKVGDLGRKS